MKMCTFKYSSKTFRRYALINPNTFLFKSCHFIYLHYLLQFFSLTSQATLENRFPYQLICCIYIVTTWELNITDFFVTFVVESFTCSGWVGEKHTCFITPLSEKELLSLHSSSDMDCANVSYWKVKSSLQ